MIISIENNLDKLPETLNTVLSQNVSAGGTILPVKNLSGINIQWSQQIGRTGEELTEIVNPLTISNGTALYNAGTTKFDHPLETPVYQIHYDSIIVSRSTTGTTGTNTAIATVSITPDSIYTQYDDATGVGTYAYKTQYYNSVSGDLSNESDWFVPSSNPTYYSLQKVRQRVKDALYNADYIKSDDVLTDWINEWCEQMNNAAVKANKGYSIGTASYSFGTAGYGTITDSLFKQATKVEITYDGISYTNSYELPMNQYSESDTFSAIRPRHSWAGDSIFRILPFGQAGTARFSYGKLNTPLENDSDELPVVLRSYTTCCVNYALFRAYANDTKPEIASQYFNLFKDGKNDFINEITPRDQSGYKTIEYVEGLSGMNEDVSITSDWFI